MLKVFFKGTVFGLGFFLSFGACLYFYISWVSDQPVDLANPLSTVGWHDTSPENKIATSSIILVVEFQKDTNEDLKPIVNEFIKKDNSVSFYYQLGDFYQPLSKSYYEHAQEGKKVLLMFVGSQSMSTMSITNDTVGGLNYIPLSKIRQLVNDA